MTPELIAKLAALPDAPGCYLYKDAEARVIYVGKAKNLRKRVASYFQDRIGHPARTLRLVREVVDLELIETDSEVEALLVENSLIKDLQPRYNVKLKDDKTYPLIAISREEFPKVFCTRDASTPNVDLIGPFISASCIGRSISCSGSSVSASAIWTSANRIRCGGPSSRASTGISNAARRRAPCASSAAITSMTSAPCAPSCRAGAKPKSWPRSPRG